MTENFISIGYFIESNKDLAREQLNRINGYLKRFGYKSYGCILYKKDVQIRKNSIPLYKIYIQAINKNSTDLYCILIGRYDISQIKNIPDNQIEGNLITKNKSLPFDCDGVTWENVELDSFC